MDEWTRGWTEDRAAIEVSSLRRMLHLARLGLLGEAFQNEVLESFELTPGAFSVLGALRGVGRPYSLKPSQLYTPLRLSSGGMTKILGRLERSGFVERTPDPEDGRGVRVTLTTRGLALHDRALRALAAAATRLLTSIPAAEKAEIDRALGRLLDALERVAEPRSADTGSTERP